MMVRMLLGFLAIYCCLLLQHGTNSAETCTQRKFDLVFMLDGSRSVRPSNFALVKEYVKNFTKIVRELGPDASQVGMIQFSSLVREEFALNRYTDKSELMQAIDNIEYMAMGTMTGTALQYVVTEALTPSHGSRLDDPSVHTVLIILTDGKSQDYQRGTVTTWQRKAKETGVEIYAIGIGRRANRAELLEMASAPKLKHTFQVERFEAIKEINLDFSGYDVCDEDECADGTDECDQICNNTIGSYVCSCNEGFVLQEDERSCEAIPVPQLSNLRITEVTHTSADIAWDIGNVAADDVDHYLLAYTPADGQGEQTILQVTDTSYELADLEPSTKYNVSVSAVSAEYFSAPLKGSFTTLSLGATTVTLSHPTLTTLTAKWKAAGGDGLTGYEVLYQLSRNGDIGGVRPLPAPTTKRCGPEQREMVLTGLEPATLYFVRVIPLHGELVGDSGSDEAKTDELSAPIVKIANTSLSGVAARWKTAFRYDVQSWTVQISSDEPGDASTKTVDGDKFNTVFRQLRPGTLYSVQVVGHVEEDGRQFSTPEGETSKRTKYLKTPRVSVIDTTVSSISFSWTKLNLDALSWTVKVYPKGQKRSMKMKEIAGDVRDAVFDDLLPMTRYKIEVTGHVMEDGETFDSPIGKQRAYTKPLTAPPVEIIELTYDSLNATWKDINTLVDSWTVALYQDGIDDVVQESNVTGEQHGLVFNGLQEVTLYTVKVIGHVEKEGSVFDSPEGSASNTTLELLFDAPDPIVECGETSTASITVVWLYSDEAESWIIDFNPEDDYDNTKTETQDNDDREYTITQLQPGTSYAIVVTGNLRRGGSIFPTGPGFEICSTEPITAPPVEVTDSTYSSLEVEWRNVNIAMDSWTVSIYVQETGELFRDVNIEDKLAHVLVFNGLKQGTYYDVEVIGHVTVQGVMHDSPPGRASGATRSLISIAGPMVECDQFSESGFIVEWSSVSSEVHSWTVKIYPNGNQEQIRIFTQERDNRRYEFNQLQPNTSYSVEVTGNVIEGEFTFNTQKGEATCNTRPLVAPPVDITNITFGSLLVEWTNINMPVVAWTVTIYEKGGNLTQTARLEDSAREMMFSGLQQDTEYDVEVIGHVLAENIMHKSPPGRAAGTTKYLVGPFLDCSKTELTSVTVDWFDVPTEMDSWTIDIRKEDSEEIETMVVTGAERLAKIDLLLPSTSYVLGIVGNVTEGNRQYTTEKEHTFCITKPLSAPLVEMVESSFQTITFAWSEINMPVVSWDLFMTTPGYEISIENVTSNTREFVFDELEPETTYSVQVYGKVLVDGETILSPAGRAVGVTTFLDLPVAMCADIDASTFSLEWVYNDSLVDSWTLTVGDPELGNNTKVQILDGDARKAVFENLMPDSDYIVSLVGHITVNFHVTRSKSLFVDAQESCETVSLTRPPVVIMNTTFSTINVQWEDINMDMDSWTVEIGLDGIEEPFRAADVRGTQRDMHFNGLSQDTVYNVRVIGHVNGNEVIHDSPPGSTFGSTKPLTGTHVQCSNTTASSVTIEWTDINVKVDSWTIKIFPEGMEQHTQEVTQESDKRKYVYEQLQPATTYVVEVVGNIVQGKNTFNTPAMRDSCTTYPSPPRDIEVIDRGVTYLVVTFDPSRGPVDSYRGTCISVDQEDDVVKGEFATNSEMRCTGLDPATEYKIVVKSVFNGLESDPIATSNVTLSPPPSGLTLIDPTTHTMMAEWQAPEAERIDRYFVTYNSSYDDVEIRVVEGDQTTLLLTDLEPNTMYSVQVQAEINEGRSEPDSASESTLSEIINLQIDEVGFTSINVSWNPSEVPHLQSYCLEYSPALQPDFETELILPSDINQFVVTDLQTATEYKLAINARYSRSESEESERFATTLALPPIGPLTFSNVTETSFVAHWLPPDGAPQPVSYTVTYYTEGMVPIIVENVESPELLIEGLESETTYNVTVSSCYQDDLTSHQIKGKETTLSPDPTSCSCTTYLRTQSQMQSMLVQMMQQIDVLNQKIDELTQDRKSKEASTLNKDS